jgi:hypothetical protein
MENWLEEVEGKEHKKAFLSEKAKQRILAKKEKVTSNYIKNGIAFDTFIAKVNELIDRVNSLPEEERHEFVEIDSRNKKTEFDNHLNIFSSSKRVYFNKKRFYLFGEKKYRYKYIRIIYFNISKDIDKVEIEIKEKYLPKGHRRKYATEDIHRLYKLNFDVLNEQLAFQIINWLAFKNDVRNLSIFI